MTTSFAHDRRTAQIAAAARDFTAQVIDEGSGTTLIVGTPQSVPDVWVDYLDGARNSYAKHGVEMALDYDDVIRGECTTLFYAALDTTGTVIGGVRAKGPYSAAHESHALLEWAGQPGLEMVSHAIDSRLEDGVVEMKTAWAANGPTAAAVAGMLARVALPTMTLTGARYIMATAADHVLRRWESSGGRVAEDIPASPYPDARYQTSLMWWDRQRIAADAKPKVLAHMVQDTRILASGATQNVWSSTSGLAA
ncbi:hypothetical protein [Nocardia sp. 348MFTsu5.1]|uniref:hypothetical protein n=1 Tax=Nocardia sp. 348MFTsu5.1 TaxID=1172185 RepID=UPI00036C32CC|nr:hypothetical protein [Nocardia sp. 348MFTsu5.1]